MFVARQPILPAIILGLFILVIALYAYMGTFSRMFADDFCTAQVGLENTPLEAIQFYYQSWTGRYSDIFVKSIVAPWQPNIHAVLAGLFIGGWALTLWWMLYEVLAAITVRRPVWAAGCLMLVLLMAAIDASPSRQNLLWLAALSPHTLPFIPLTITIGLLLWYFRTVHTPVRQGIIVLVVGSLVIITAGFSEVFAILQVVLCVTLLGIIWVGKPPQYRVLLITMGLLLIIAVIALLITGLAPGNFSRQTQINTTFDRFSLLQLVYVLPFLTLLFITAETYGLALSVFVFLVTFVGLFWWYAPPYRHALKALPLPKPFLKWVMMIILFVFGLVMLVLAPSVYTTGLIISRTMFAARFFLVCLAAFLAYVTAVQVARLDVLARLAQRPVYRITRLTIMGLLVGLPLVILIRQGQIIPNFAVFAAEWDARHLLILEAAAAAEATIHVPELTYSMENYLELEQMQSEARANWVNGCASNFYGGIEVFVAEPK